MANDATPFDTPLPAKELSARLRRLTRHRIVRALVEAAGSTPCHLVGGAVRDAALGLQVMDFDCVVAGQGIEIVDRLAGTLPAKRVDLGREAFASYRLVAADGQLDVWDRGPKSLTEDLERRDLTINSVALELPEGRIEDPRGGLADLADGVLRATTARSFEADALRVLRLARFAAQLRGVRVEATTLELARQAAPGLSAIASERTRYELALLFSCRHAGPGIEVLVRSGALAALTRGAGEAKSVLRGLTTRVGRLENWLERLGVPATSGSVARWHVVLSALPGAGVDTLEHLRRAGVVDRATARSLARLAREVSLPTDLAGQRRFLHRGGLTWRQAVAALAALGTAGPEIDRAVTQLQTLVAEEGDALLAPRPLLDGNEVCELLCLEPGPEVGRALHALVAAQVDGAVRSRDQARRLLLNRSRRRRQPED